jgi:NAD+ diphosphatase
MNKFPNFFSFPELDRMTEYRTKKEMVKEILITKDPFFIPVFDSKNLIKYDPEPEAVFLKNYEITNHPLREFIFLGKFEEEYYFAFQVVEEKEFIKNKNFKFEDLRRVAPLLNSREAAILAYAKGIIYWKNRVKFCGMCGSPTILEEGGHRAFCSSCNTNFFPQTDPAIITIVTYQNKCLLARQAAWPPKRYSTIAGFVEPGESLEDAVSREVFEETGVKLKSIKYHSSQPWPFPGSIMIGFEAEAKTTEISLNDHELENAGWFSREEIVEKLKQEELKLSTLISISFRLIEDWFNSGSELSLREIILSLERKQV